MKLLNFPLLTFLAFVVIGISIVVAITWALIDIRRERQQ